jgi:hypothetical protein
MEDEHAIVNEIVFASETLSIGACGLRVIHLKIATRYFN